MKKLIFVVGACLAAVGCGAPVDEVAEEAISLEAKDDRLGNRYIDVFGGAMHFDDQVHYADLPNGGYKAGFTFRAAAGSSSKVVLRVSGGKAPSTLKIYGPKTNGKYPYVGTARQFTENDGLTVSVFYLEPRKDGIYLAVASTTRRLGGVAEVSLHCGSGEGTCELGCAVIRLYDPQCGVDGVTYGNKPSAACYDVPIEHAGECKSIEPPPAGCETVLCKPNQICVMQEIVCITTPCDPIPTCVCAAEGICITGSTWNPDTCSCSNLCDGVRCEAGHHCEAVGNAVSCVPDAPPSCGVEGLCAAGYFWNAETCACMSDCAFMRCAAGYTCTNLADRAACVPNDPVPTCDGVTCADGEHCELVDVVCVRAPCYPQPTCRPNTVAPCIRTGCSGQICAKSSMISTCEYRAEYACYASATCEPQSDGSCGWTKSSTLSACLASPPPLF